jgi:hypothetical protein
MKLTLARLAFTAWVAWLLALGIMACLSYRQVLHPSFLYLGIPLVVQLLCTIALLGGGVWRVVRGPRRWKAVAWMLFGVLPMLWMAAFVEYGLAFVSGRNHRPNFLIGSAEAANSLIAEPYLRVRYPYQHEGERFVLWSDSPEVDAKKMAAMDAHIRAMEEAFGRLPRYKVYWVRGPVWGIEGRGGSGWAVGINPAMPDAVTGRVDRHEVAHFVLDEFLPFGNETPKLLHEGWAELHSPPTPESHWPDCWASQQEGRLPSLRALTGPAYYFNSIEPMYSLGSVLVEYILKRFGHEKFLELCSTCREATFADDVQRVLGLSLDELDRAYQQDLARRAASTKGSLLAAKLADGVDKVRWRRLVEDACAEMERLVSASKQSSITVVEEYDGKEKNGQTTAGRHRYEYFFDSKRYAEWRCFPHISEVFVSTTDVGFGLQKKPDERSWQLRGYSVRGPQSEVAMPRPREKPMFLWNPPPWLPRGSGLTITGMRPRDAASQIVRVSFVQTREGGGRWARMQGWIDLDPTCGYGIIEKKFDCFDEKGNPTSSSHLAIHYETIDGRHVPKTMSSDDTDGMHGNSTRSKTTVESCRFGPPSAKVFELASYGDFSLPEPVRESPPPVYTLTWVAGGFTLLTLLLAPCLKLKSGCCR